MDVSPRTIKSPKRYFVIEIQRKAPSASLTSASVKQMISAQFIRLFGTAGFAAIDLEVFIQGPTRAICSVQNELAVNLRCSLALPPPRLPGIPDLECFHVLREASFMQALFHDSRLDFPPLV
jgi:RNase P/RNase MRP subunit POP5